MKCIILEGGARISVGSEEGLYPKVEAGRRKKILSK
jgi:hypothetical protein